MSAGEIALAHNGQVSYVFFAQCLLGACVVCIVCIQSFVVSLPSHKTYVIIHSALFIKLVNVDALRKVVLSHGVGMTTTTDSELIAQVWY